MRFRLLGPLRVWNGETWSPVRAAQQRVVLSMLLIEPGRVVSTDRLIDEIWGERQPPAAGPVLRGYVLRLRRLLDSAPVAGSALLTQPSGYELVAGAEDVDALIFDRLVASGRRSLADGDGERAVNDLSEALALWRGPALADVPVGPTIVGHVAALERARLAATVDYTAGQLYLGRHDEIIGELERLVALHPLLERLWEHLVLALHRSGRRADALDAYRRARTVLTAELGLEPGRRLQDLQRAILAERRSAADRQRSTDPADSPAVSASSVPRQLPADPGEFTGRTEELRHLDTIVSADDRRTVATVITGAAGVGKTALAVHWAHRVAGRFPDGQLYVNLRGYDPDQPMVATEALAGFLTALGLAGRAIPAGLDERAARFRTEVSGRRMLIVLDNAASVEQVRPLLPGTGTNAVVVTSRDSLAGLVARDGAQRLDLDLLPARDARALLDRLVGGRAEPDGMAALVQRSGRLPLALRVVAELANSRADRSLADLADELADQQRRLELLDAGGDPRAAVTAVFSWSIRHLPPDAGRAFRLIGLFPGPDLDACALGALADTASGPARRALDTLTRANLLYRTATDRYAVHDLLRAYAAGLAATDLDPSDRRAALQRLFDHYVTAGSAAAERPDTGRHWLDVERRTLVRVVAHAAAHGWPTHAVRLAAVLHDHLDSGGWYTDAIAVHTQARDAAEQIGDRSAHAHAWYGLGVTHLRLGTHATAGQCLRLALDRFRQTGDRRNEVRTRLALGVLHAQTGRRAAAAADFQRAAEQSGDLGDDGSRVNALINLGIVAAQAGRHDAAAGHLGHAVDISRRLGDRRRQADALVNLGVLDGWAGRHAAAAGHCEEALALYRRVGDRAGEARALHNLGEVQGCLGHDAEAAVAYERARAIFREIGDRVGEAQTTDPAADVPGVVDD
ncbi:AfsR/SARP family transcriptional regulator [Virgisporangium aurantiacum]|uniref:XRE family transcriptional regulator n=1 Tax=Virgisporangium aurantiacum TaxID=175570 RepID=A0A8J4EAC3_9ACTN|nr:BTAD domain-containing putative transcriptional regulator [Virgisporangium aurantiacum]GIJ64632.1 XRE family transcriptional regulator [Virgisporangium aurantiacum]